MNGGVCSSRNHCLCPPGFTGRLCQFPLQQTQQAQAARGNKQPVYPVSLKPDIQKLVEQSGLGRTQLTQTHSVFTLPLSQAGHHSSESMYHLFLHLSVGLNDSGNRFSHTLFFTVFSADKFTCSPLIRHLCSHSAYRANRRQENWAAPVPIKTKTKGPLLPRDHTEASCEDYHMLQ